jgi:hypothetical protein
MPRQRTAILLETEENIRELARHRPHRLVGGGHRKTPPALGERTSCSFFVCRSTTGVRALNEDFGGFKNRPVGFAEWLLKG